VYDVSTPNTKNFIANGYVIHNCNLTTGNGLKINTEDDFYHAVKALTIIGTLQASYTDFKYLGNASKQITEKEALLGVSIGGLMNNPSILLDPKIQQKGAKIAKDVNEIWAKKIGINPAARITCIKPDGNTGATLGCASGIHPYHARRFFRRVQCNKQDTVYKFFKKHNPHMCEPSIWSTNKTDDVITFPITVPEIAMIKSDLSALKHLEIIKSTQQNWVLPGTTKYNQKPVTHNVSCTVLVEDDEWEKVFNYIYDNKQFFAAVSLLPKKGDKIYKQAPMESITTPEDEAKWNELVTKFKPVNYKHLVEDDDNTKAVETAACSGNNCEIP
jgi:ribonucleoside-diphosphate reductase alpha chain